MSSSKYELIRNPADLETLSRPFLNDQEMLKSTLRYEIACRKRLQCLVIIPWAILAATIPSIIVGAGLLVQDAKNIRISTTIYCMWR